MADFLVTHTPFVGQVVFQYVRRGTLSRVLTFPQSKDHPVVRVGYVALRLYVRPDVSRGCASLTCLLRWAIESLKDASFFAKHAPGIPASDLMALQALGDRWTRYLASGVFRLSIPITTKLGAPGPADFWTTNYAYQDLPEMAPRLLEELKESSLVIFKGDLNYRK